MFVVLPIGVAWRGVLCGRVFYFEDIAAYFEPLWTAAARSMTKGELPSWALGAWSGQPLLGDPQLGIFYPPHWMWLALAPVRAYAISIVFHSALAASGTYVLARFLGRSRVASCTAAIAFSVGAYFVLEARHEMFLVSAAWIPWLLAAIAAYAAHGRTRGLALIAATLALAILGGGWSMLVFAVPVVIVFACARARFAPQRLIGIGLGLGLGLGLASIQLLPALAHARLSPRALPLADAFAGSYAWPSLRYAITLVLPLWYGDDARGTYLGAPDQWELSGYGAGVLIAGFAIASLLRRGGRGERAVYVVLVLFAMIAALGPHGPLWPILKGLPLVGRARCPARALFIYTLVAPLLAAAGIDQLRARLPLRALAFVWAVPVLVALELLIGLRAENPTVPVEATYIAPAVMPSFRAELASSTMQSRTLIDVHLGQRFHNGGLRWGFESPGGYSSLPLWRYLHLLWIANHARTYPGSPTPELAHDLSAQGLWTYGSPIVDLLDVRWALVPRERSPDGSGWSLATRGEDGIDLWRNEEALPRAFVVHAATSVASEGEAASAMATPSFDPTHDVILEEPSALKAAPAASPASPARLVERRGADARYAIELDAPGIFVLAEPHEPSWTVTIDGAPARLLRVDYALMGVAIGAGKHELAFVRSDRPLRTGAMLTLLSLLVCAALALRRAPA